MFNRKIMTWYEKEYELFIAQVKFFDNSITGMGQTKQDALDDLSIKLEREIKKSRGYERNLI